MTDTTPEIITSLYVVRDIVAADLFGGIIRAANDEVARRSFHDLLQQKDSPIAAHRGDYNLLYLGDINNHGEIYHGDIFNKVDLPRIIAKGQDWLDANKETTA